MRSYIFDLTHYTNLLNIFLMAYYQHNEKVEDRIKKERIVKKSNQVDIK